MGERSDPAPVSASRVLALVLNWNNAVETKACLESLKGQTHVPLDVLVLDNASEDDSLARIREAWPEVEYVRNPSNLGYGGGNNVGLRMALARRVPFVLVLNNDTVLEADCVAELMRAAQDHPEAAALSPKSFILEEPGKLYCAGGTWDPAGYPRMIGFRQEDGVEFDRAREVDWLNGCAVLFRSERLRSVGLFDERFFHTFEDTDWSLRARRAGYTLRIAPEARLAHRVSGSLSGRPAVAYAYYYTRNHLLFVQSNLRGRDRLKGLFGVLVRSLRALKRARKNRREELPEIRRAMLRALLDYARGRFGIAQGHAREPESREERRWG